MEDGDLLKEAFLFFDFDENFTEQDLSSRFHELAGKYHPDKGEYSSAEIFCRVIDYRQVLRQYLTGNKFKPSETDYQLYRRAKMMEREALEAYYLKTRGNKIWLDVQDNPPLKELRIELFRVIEIYDKITKEYPDSIWIPDIIMSMDKIAVWMK